MTAIVNERKPEHEIDNMFIERWSPRAFSSEVIEKETLLKLFEAAKWAPSCYNEQPWLFAYADKEESLKTFRSLLAPKNQLWANKAPVLCFVFARNKFSFNNNFNFWAQFDCGAAWASLAFQAVKLGLFAHGMAGFDRENVYGKLNISRDDYTAVAAIAIGKYGDINELVPEFLEAEKPNFRKSLSEIIKEY